MIAEQSAWSTNTGLGLWIGITILLVEIGMLVSRPLGYYDEALDAGRRLAAYIGPVWPLELLFGLLIAGAIMSLVAHRVEFVRLQEPDVALDLLREASGALQLSGLLGTFVGLSASVHALDGRDQAAMLAQLMQGTGTAIGSTVVSTIGGLIACSFRFTFARLWR